MFDQIELKAVTIRAEYECVLLRLSLNCDCNEPKPQHRVASCRVAWFGIAHSLAQRNSNCSVRRCVIRVCEKEVIDVGYLARLCFGTWGSSMV